jgi:cell division protein FtsN
LPKGPVMIADIVLGGPAATAQKVAMAAVDVPPPAAFVVMLGTFRVHENATDLVAQARRLGVDATIAAGAKYSVVRTGPFETRLAAARIARRLTEAGLEAVVMAAR